MVESADTFPKILLDNVQKFGHNKIAIREKDFGIWQSYSWQDYLDHVRDFALGLASLGFKRGDVMAVIGDNRPQLYWGMAAAQSLGGVPVPLYQDAIETELEFILDHSEAKFALTEDQEQRKNSQHRIHYLRRPQRDAQLHRAISHGLYPCSGAGPQIR
jgi:long-chain acyl-CoA synthetase